VGEQGMDALETFAWGYFMKVKLPQAWE